MARDTDPRRPLLEYHPDAYVLLHDGAGEAILVADPKTGQVIEGNGRLAELTGYCKKTFRRLSVDRLFQHPILEEKALLDWLSGHRIVRENEAFLRRRRDPPLPVSVTSSRIEVGGRSLLHIIARDVSRERRVVADLRQAKETLAALSLAGTHLMVETSGEAIYRVITRELLRLGFHSVILTARAKPTNAPPSFCVSFTSFTKPLKREVERIIGHPLEELSVSPDKSRLLRRLLALGRTIQTDRLTEAANEISDGMGQKQIQRLLGLLGVKHAILAPLRYDQGISGALLVGSARLRRGDPEAIDAFALQASIALEKARLFEELRQHQAGLELEVTHRTEELTRAVSALVESDRRKDNFLANVSHELRTPLVTVLGYSDLLLSGKLGDLSQRQRESLTVVSSSARRLRTFIEELLEYSRYELTREVYRFDWLDMTDLMRHSVVALAPRLAQRRIETRLRTAKSLPLIWGDRDRVLQILTNLIGNAERHVPDGGKIWLAAARAHEGFVAISITDNGTGIPSEHLDRIFDRLYQVGDAVKRRDKEAGLGLGLSITKSIVEAHGGRITVRSRVDRGTCFRFTLPTTASQRKDDRPALLDEKLALEGFR